MLRPFLHLLVVQPFGHENSCWLYSPTALRPYSPTGMKTGHENGCYIESFCIGIISFSNAENAEGNAEVRRDFLGKMSCNSYASVNDISCVGAPEESAEILGYYRQDYNANATPFLTTGY